MAVPRKKTKQTFLQQNCFWMTMRFWNVCPDSFFETAKRLYVPAALLNYKFSLLQEKGELVNTLYIRKSDFLKNDLGAYDDATHFEYE